ncbi:MAG: PAS domain S-box protein [Syntrophales bacterium]|jgi:PAS domain S-box-containing protein
MINPQKVSHPVTPTRHPGKNRGGIRAEEVIDMSDEKEKSSYNSLILIFAALAAGVIAIGYLSYRGYERQYRTSVESQLSAVALLKVNELVSWRRERLADAAVFHGNKDFSELVRRYLTAPGDIEAQERLREWLKHLQTAYRYDMVMILDAGHTKKMVFPSVPERSRSYISPLTSELLKLGKVACEDFYWNEENQKIYLKILAPIRADEKGSRLLGVLVLRIDPEKYLYPLISRWPTPSETAETLLVRREGNEAVFLNELRFQKDTALKLRISLDKTDLPAVQAALGHTGIVEGRDYRRETVVAAVEPVPDSPWFIVARMDLTEVYAPLKERLYLTVFIVVVLMAGAGMGVAMIWRQQRTRFYRDKFEAAETLRESESRLKAITGSARDAIVMMDPAGMVTYWNPAAEVLFDYTSDEAMGRNLHDMIAPLRYHVAHLAALPEFKRTGRGGAVGKTLELQARRKDGREIMVALSLSAVHIKGGWHAVGIIRDITEQKIAETTGP